MRSKALIISLLGHLTVLGIFSFSFGNKIPQINFTDVGFLGAILNKSDLMSASIPFRDWPRKDISLKKSNMLTLVKAAPETSSYIFPDYFKPQVDLTFNANKITFIPQPIPDSVIPRRKDSVIMFYPLLPYHFTLYFRDRQAVHIELMFNIISKESKHSVVVKRKISSGNLQVDLLCMRYISRYLFIQQAGFLTNTWQTVKIDLSPKK